VLIAAGDSILIVLREKYTAQNTIWIYIHHAQVTRDTNDGLGIEGEKCSSLGNKGLRHPEQCI
jgi:hypothetical protein